MTITTAAPSGYRIEKVEQASDELVRKVAELTWACDRAAVRRVGAKPGLRTRASQLDLGAIDRKLIAEWAAIDPAGYRLDWVPSETHRGKGIGKWVKARMVERILREMPEARIIRTENPGSNAAMLAINVGMGFRPAWKEVLWQMPLADAQRYARS